MRRCCVLDWIDSYEWGINWKVTKTTDAWGWVGWEAGDGTDCGVAVGAACSVEWSVEWVAGWSSEWSAWCSVTWSASVASTGWIWASVRVPVVESRTSFRMSLKSHSHIIIILHTLRWCFWWCRICCGWFWCGSRISYMNKQFRLYPVEQFALLRLSLKWLHGL